jgi:hypothetical protein
MYQSSCFLRDYLGESDHNDSSGVLVVLNEKYDRFIVDVAESLLDILQTVSKLVFRVEDTPRLLVARSFACFIASSCCSFA